MKEKLSAIITLGFIFSLFFYYKLINPVENEIVNSNVNNAEHIPNIKVIENDNIPLIDEIAVEKNVEGSCDLDIDMTNGMDFSSAFKYYRNCNGSNSTFSWNNNKYSTILISEVESNDKEKIQLNDDSNLVVDKKHLKLQSNIIGDNSNIE